MQIKEIGDMSQIVTWHSSFENLNTREKLMAVGKA